MNLIILFTIGLAIAAYLLFLSKSRIKQSKNKFDFFRALNELLIVTDKNLNIIFTSDAVSSKWDYRHDDLAGKSLLNFISEDKSDDIYKDIFNKSIDGKFLETNFINKTGELSEIVFSVSVIETGSADNFLIFIGRENSKEKAARKELIRRAEEKEEIIKNLTHKYRNDLQIISSMLYSASKKINGIEAKNIFIELQNKLREFSSTYPRNNNSAVKSRVNLFNLFDSTGKIPNKGEDLKKKNSRN